MCEYEKVKVGFIGFGNMAQAIAYGLIGQNAMEGDQIYACAKDWEKLCKNTESYGIHPCHDAAEVAEASDIVFICVKPYMVSKVLNPITVILQKKIVISVAVGVLFDDYEKILLPGTHHLSTLPNTPVSVGEGIFICEDKHSLAEDEWEAVYELLSQIALVKPVAKEHMSTAGTIAGCGPAFASMFIEALGDAGVLHGLPRQTAYELAGQMVAGTGKMLVESGKHPGVLKDGVCSPGGETIQGVVALERSNFRAAVINAIDTIEGKKK